MSRGEIIAVEKVEDCRVGALGGWRSFTRNFACHNDAADDETKMSYFYRDEFKVTTLFLWHPKLENWELLVMAGRTGQEDEGEW
mmetsp:Transcript_3270/g.4933  ORF Transcript_3270/g.4933 Transcript_3270/m.4933 type:complete len:84 (+) Transcript_3270:349-600(+)